MEKTIVFTLCVLFSLFMVHGAVKNVASYMEQVGGKVVCNQDGSVLC